MRKTLSWKGLLAHVQVVKLESKITEVWLANDAKALTIIAQDVEQQHQTKIRSALRAMVTWNTLFEYYNHTTLDNRVAMTRRLHEFKTNEDTSDELVVGLKTLEEPVDEEQQMVVLLSSLPA
ncbi:polyprotein [Phytophthora megakarya]|uniref:Polyprotein n=1 Tax=Phytophthora megakarya TaxID=4795 RepID=A0A225VSQ3_9STRA|nr:polyprotein [Phytophthora megakarya]